MKHLGDFDAASVLYTKFTTYRPSTGAPFTLAGTPVVSIYKDGSLTQSTAGITLTVDFDGLTGLHHLAIDTSADGTFYSAGSHFEAVITTGTVGDQLLRDAYARCYDADGTALWTYRYTATNSFNEEEGHDVVVGPNRAIYVTGMNDQQATSQIRGVTFCLCPAAQGVCLLAPQARSAFPVTAMAGIDVDQDGWRDLVFDIPLLVESGHWRSKLHRVVVVDCDEQTQIERVVTRNGLPPEVVRRIISSQAPRHTRLSAADIVLSNQDRTMEALSCDVEQLAESFGLSLRNRN